MTIKEMQDTLVAYREKADALSVSITEKSKGEDYDSSDDVGKLKSIVSESEAVQASLEKARADQDLDLRRRAIGSFLDSPRPRVADTVLADSPASPARSNPAAIPAVARRYGQLKAFRGEGAEARAYAAGQWIRGALFGDSNAQRWCNEHGPEFQAALGETVNTAGGYLVPDVLLNTIIDLREERGVFRQFAQSEAMSRDHQEIPKRNSGLTAYAMGENKEITASDPAFDAVGVTAKKWGTLTKIGSEVAEDAIISLADWVAQEIAYAFADKEDEAGFNGDGTSTYHGIFGATVKVNDGNHAGSIYDAASGNTAFSTLDLVDFEGALGTLPQYAARNAAWFISRVGFFQSMQRLMDAAGGNTIDSLQRGPTGLQFLGLPVVISQVLNATVAADVSAIKCLVGDLGMAAIFGDRRGVEVVSDSSRYLEFDQVAIRGITRFGITVHSLGDGSNAGPIVALKTPAS